MKQASRIILVDDHRIVREGIRALLESVEGINVVGEADDKEGLFALMSENECDIVFMDITLPGTGGIEITSMLKKSHPEVRVIILSMYNSEEFIFNALKAGAKGYLPKNTTRQELVEAVTEVMEGGEYLGEPVSSIILRSYIRMAREENRTAEPSEDQLTARETDILRLFAEGLSNKEIAEQLFISTRTVESHKNHIMRKLGLRSTVDLVKFAIRNGIVEM